MLFCTIFFVIKCICRFLLFRSYAVHLRQFHMWDLCCNCCIHYYFCDCLPCIIFYGMSPFILVDWCVGRHRHRRPFQTICHFNLSHFVTFVCALSRRQQAQSITTKNWNQSVCVCVDFVTFPFCFNNETIFICFDFARFFWCLLSQCIQKTYSFFEWPVWTMC